MSQVVIAKAPNLNFIITSKLPNERKNCQLPIIIKKNGFFDWDANGFLTWFGGGGHVYNVKPLATTIIKKAYDLNIFCSFIESINIRLQDISDSVLYQFIDYLKGRGIDDFTIKTHGRLALKYIVYLSTTYPEWQLSTDQPKTSNNYKVNYTILKIKKGYLEISYLDHRCFSGLIKINNEAEYVHDYELIKWLDAIYCTSYHPNINDFIISRWQALTTILEITGSRISEVHQITRSLFKEASKHLLEQDKMPVIRDIPIMKGKYKGKTRQVKTSKEDVQIVLWHIAMVEQMFPNLKHDAIFVDMKHGTPLKPLYLKNYTKKIINNSKYCRDLRHLSNHSFRHRFITINIAKAIKRISASGSYKNILNVAATACLKLSMHASQQSLAHYVHLASDFNEYHENHTGVNHTSKQISVRLKKMISIAKSHEIKAIDDKEALNSLLNTLHEFRIFE